MREINGHKVNECNEAIGITADERDPDNGNASHHYTLGYVDGGGHKQLFTVQFQHGPIKEVGVNGLTNEALLAIVIDRMEGFQSGKYACRENALALTKLHEARMWLFERTRERLSRGVEGTHQK